MIGDNPFVVAVVVVGLAAFLWLKLGRRHDPRRCPQCQAIALSLAEAAFDCPKCGTPLVRNPDGTLRRR